MTEAYAAAEPTEEFSASAHSAETEEDAKASRPSLMRADFAELAKEKSRVPPSPAGGLWDGSGPDEGARL